MTRDLLVDQDALREQVRGNYREVAVDPGASFHFHTGPSLAAAWVMRPPRPARCQTGRWSPSPAGATHSRCGGRRPVKRRSTSAPAPGSIPSSPPARSAPDGHVVGVDMTSEMLAKSHQTTEALGLANVEFRRGLAESLPVADCWADVVISNGVINLCADKHAVFAEIFRVLSPGGRLQSADIANGRPVPAEALRDIDLWTG
jgi:arsenite methyltransferase